MLQRIAVLMLCLGLAACGFQLRRELQLPAALQGVRVQTPDPYSPLQQGLERALERAGAKPVADGKAVLRIASATLEQRPLSVGATGRVQEFLLVYRAEVELIDAGGQSQMPLQIVELQREYSFDTAQSLGSPAEQDVLSDELEREMVDAILRRVDAVLRG